MKRIFVYYSLSGNGDAVAEIMKELGFDVLKVEPLKPIPTAALPKFLVGGMQATLRKKAPLATDLSPLDDCDEIVIGSPIWAGKLSSPINTVLEAYAQKVSAAILYSGGGKCDGCIKYIAKKFGIAAALPLKQPLDDIPGTKKAIEEFFS